MDFHEESSTISDIVQGSSSSISAQSQVVNPHENPKVHGDSSKRVSGSSKESNNIASESMVFLLQKRQNKATEDSDDDTFSRTTSSIPSSNTPLFTEIPIAYVILFITHLVLFTLSVYRILPKECEVSDVELQDEYLVKKGHYANLPPLRCADCFSRIKNQELIT
jgi:hypothetical protein